MIIETVIDQLLHCSDPDGVKLGNELKLKYENWRRSSIFDRKAFEEISKAIMDKRNEIYAESRYNNKNDERKTV